MPPNTFGRQCALYGKTSPQGASWVAQLAARLTGGEVRVLLDEWAKPRPRDGAAFATECPYVRNQAARMRYDE